MDRSRSSAALSSRSARTAAPRRAARAPRRAPQGVHVLLLPRRAACHQLGAATDPGDRLVGRVVAQNRRPPLPQRRHLLVQGRLRRVQLDPLGRPARLLVHLGRRQLARQAGALGLERGDDVDVGRRIERGHDGPAPLAQEGRGAPGTLDEALHPAEGVGQVLLAARRQLGGGGGGLGVEALQGVVELALLVPAHDEALRSGPAARREVGQLGAREPAAHRQQLGRDRVVRAGGGGLALQGADLAADLADEVAEPFEVLRRGRQPALGPLPAPSVLEHPRRLLDDHAPVLGTGVEHGVELALADDHVLLSAHARVAQQLLDVEQPARRPVDGVLAVARAEQGPGDGDLGQVDRQLARRVVDGQRDLGPAQLGS